VGGPVSSLMSVQLSRNLSRGRRGVPVGVRRSVVTIALPGVICDAPCLAVSSGAQGVCCTGQKATREEESDGTRTSIDDQDESNCESAAISDKEEAGSCAAQGGCVLAERSELRWDAQVSGVRAHFPTRGCAGCASPSGARGRRHICQCRQCVAPAQDDERKQRQQPSRERCERARSEPLFHQSRRSARVGLPGRHSCERDRDQSSEQLARRSGTPRTTSLARDHSLWTAKRGSAANRHVARRSA
jgi:hypothetical protein